MRQKMRMAPGQPARPKSVPPPFPEPEQPEARGDETPPSSDSVLREDDIFVYPEAPTGPRPKSIPPPLPAQPGQIAIVEEDDVYEPRRDSVVCEDDIPGGPVHVMYERLKQEDYQGALMAAEAVLAREPDRHDAQECREQCYVALRKLYLSRIGPLHRVPQLSMEPEDVSRRISDRRAESLLAHVDGMRSIGAIVALSELPPVETLRVLSELFLREVIELADD